MGNRLIRKQDVIALFMILLPYTVLLGPQSVAQSVLNVEPSPKMPTVSRMALVIGNGSYLPTPLETPIKDAFGITAVLKSIGFQVVTAFNLNHADLVARIAQFSQQLAANSTVVFFYAGHAAQVAGQNYLVPIDATLAFEQEIPDKTVAFQWILSEIANAQPTMTLIILDACRGNPFTHWFQIAQVGLADMTAPPHTVIAYATAPLRTIADDPTWEYSPYSDALMVYLGKFDLTINELFRQVHDLIDRRTEGKQKPWFQSALSDEIYLYSSVKPIHTVSESIPSALPSEEAAPTQTIAAIPPPVTPPILPVQPHPSDSPSMDTLLPPPSPAVSNAVMEVRADFAALQAARLRNQAEIYLNEQVIYRIENWQKAAQQGVPEAQLLYGLCILSGIGTAVDEQQALTWFQKAAEQGLALAQTQLGLAYQQGQGVPADPVQAFIWFQKAAEQHDALAQHILGWIYQEGRMVAEDDAIALQWFQKAAEQGLTAAQLHLGLIYQEGRMVSTDYAQAAIWFQKAAEQGDALAQMALAMLYYEGYGVTRNMTEAQQWLQKSAEQGHDVAQYTLGRMYLEGLGIKPDTDNALYWLEKAAEQDHATAQNTLGGLYFQGRGVKKNLPMALHWFQQAAHNGLAAAQNNVGMLYQEGQGVKRDLVEAYVWFSLAAQQNDKEALQNQRNLTKRLTAQQRQQAQARLKTFESGSNN